MNHKDFHGGNFKVLKSFYLVIHHNSANTMSAKEYKIPCGAEIAITDRQTNGYFGFNASSKQNSVDWDLVHDGEIDLDGFTHIDECWIERLGFNEPDLQIQHQIDCTLAKMTTISFIDAVHKKLKKLENDYNAMIARVKQLPFEQHGEYTCVIECEDNRQHKHAIYPDNSRNVYVVNIHGDPIKTVLFPWNFDDLQHKVCRIEGRENNYDDLAAAKTFIENCQKGLDMLSQILVQIKRDASVALREKRDTVNSVYDFFKEV